MMNLSYVFKQDGSNISTDTHKAIMIEIFETYTIYKYQTNIKKSDSIYFEKHKDVLIPV